MNGGNPMLGLMMGVALAATTDDVQVVTITKIEDDRVVVEQATVVRSGSWADVTVTEVETDPVEPIEPVVVVIEPPDE